VSLVIAEFWQVDRRLQSRPKPHVWRVEHCICLLFVAERAVKPEDLIASMWNLSHRLLIEFVHDARFNNVLCHCGKLFQEAMTGGAKKVLS